MKTTTILGALFTAAMTLVPAGASTFLFPFTSPSGDLHSSTASYTITVGSASATITASTLVGSGTAPDLYGKNLGTDENGLGTAGNVDDEIVPTDAIVLDFSQIHNITSLSIQMASVQSASMDDWQIYGSNTKPTAATFSNPGTKLFSSAQTTDQQLTNSFLTLPDTYTYYTIEVPAVAGCSPDVLLGAVEITTATPEPGTLFLLGFATLGLVAGRKFLRS
jgi:hypothetical protein